MTKRKSGSDGGVGGEVGPIVLDSLLEGADASRVPGLQRVEPWNSIVSIASFKVESCGTSTGQQRLILPFNGRRAWGLPDAVPRSALLAFQHCAQAAGVMYKDRFHLPGRTARSSAASTSLLMCLPVHAQMRSPPRSAR